MNDATSGTLAVTLVSGAEILLGVACIIIGAALAILLRPPTDSRLRLSLGLGSLVLVLLGVLQLLPHATELLGPVGVGLSRLLTLLAGAIAALAAATAVPAAVVAVTRSRAARAQGTGDDEDEAGAPRGEPQRGRQGRPDTAVSGPGVRAWAHDLNNLLTMIAGHSYLLRLSSADGAGSGGGAAADRNAASLTAIEDATRRAEALCAQMLAPGSGSGPGSTSTAEGDTSGRGSRRDPSLAPGRGHGAHASDDADDHTESGRAHAAIRQPARVLILDDEPELLRLAAGYLERLGIETIVTPDPDEAIEILLTEGPRIEAVVLDYLMPLRTGDEVLREIREFSAVDVYLTSGFSRSEISDPELNAELSGFIAKPFRFEDFERRFGAARTAFGRKNSA